MTDCMSRRFTFAAPPDPAAWIGDVLRLAFARPKDVPPAFERLIARLNGLR